MSFARFLEQRRTELGLSRKDLAAQSGLSYPYVSQLETGDRPPALKAMRQLAPVLDVPVEELAAMAATGSWGSSSYSSEMSMPSPSMQSGLLTSSPSTPTGREKALLSVERRLRDVPPLDRITILNQLIAQAVSELSDAEN
jgi:transcriptional regulator with XRE-family HTH domain